MKIINKKDRLMTSNLKSCPFCGNEAYKESGFSPLESIEYVWCSTEDCCLSPTGKGDCVWVDVEEWNQRYEHLAFRITELIKNDAYAISFQTMGLYRKALIDNIESMIIGEK